MKRIEIFISLLILLLLGCASTQKSSKQEQQSPLKPQIEQVEDLDPVTLKDDDFTIPAKYKEPKLDQQTIISAKDTSASSEIDTSLVKTVKIRGFRVQIGQVINEEDAAEMQRLAMLTFEDANVYLVFDAPNYKIRVGDFERRREAEELQAKSIALGYKDAWIVPTMIEKKVYK